MSFQPKPLSHKILAGLIIEAPCSGNKVLCAILFACSFLPFGFVSFGILFAFVQEQYE
jgi:hypothetical protein